MSMLSVQMLLMQHHFMLLTTNFKALLSLDLDDGIWCPLQTWSSQIRVAIFKTSKRNFVAV